MLWECSFQLWGKLIHEIEHESVEQNLRYQGQYLDRETGLHYNTFRYYDLDIGRFTQPDLIGLLGGLNPYQYAPNGLLGGTVGGLLVQIMVMEKIRWISS
ncbi:RHS repeat-associated core domain-containing protein [Gilliamella sp. ESL0232]|nr:RHS repeat-associated core domain-containing protein [Gilliamella sp. ESL0232]